MQLAYWVQQLIVLALKLEKPRKDWTELVIHHIVTIWLVGWSYAVNLTLIGNASMYKTRLRLGIWLVCVITDVFSYISLLDYGCIRYLPRCMPVHPHSDTRR